MDASRYEYIKNLVAERRVKGQLDFQYALDPNTHTIIENSKKDALALINYYTSLSREPTIIYYGFELAGRKDTK